MQNGKAAAGDEAVSHIEHGEIHELGLDHIHHITEPNPVDHIAQAAGIDGGDAPALKLVETQGVFGIFPDNGQGEYRENHREEPLLILEAGEGGAVIAHIGETQKSGDEGYFRMQRDIGEGQILGKLIQAHHRGGEEKIGKNGHGGNLPGKYIFLTMIPCFVGKVKQPLLTERL